MVYKKLMMMVLAMLLLPLSVHAAPPHQGTPQTQTMNYPDFGLIFEYPATWQSADEQGFNFLLIQPPAEGKQANFVGMQSTRLKDGEDMTTFFDQFASQFASTVTEGEFGGVVALSMPLPPDGNGRQGQLIGFMVSEFEFALLIFSGNGDEWEAFAGEFQVILDTAQVTLTDLDIAALDAELLASFEADTILRLGADDAPIKMVEVLDFSCPHCIDYSTNIARIIQDYVNPGILQLEFHFVTFVGQELSQVATHAQYCAAGLGFGWQAHELIADIYFNQGAAGYTVENINSRVAQLDVDADAFATCLESQSHADLLVRDDAFADSVGIQGTPSLLFAREDGTFDFIRRDNGDPVSGALPLRPLYDYFEGLLAE